MTSALVALHLAANAGKDRTVVPTGSTPTTKRSGREPVLPCSWPRPVVLQNW
jgi:hypothetical protein